MSARKTDIESGTPQRRRHRASVLAAAALALGSLGIFVPVSTAAAGTPGTLVMGPQAMEGDLKVPPGTVLSVGYDFTIPGNHPATTVQFANAQVTFNATCLNGPGGGSFTVTMPTASYGDGSGDSNWYPSGDQHSPQVYEGQIAVPDLCAGGTVRLQQGGTFSATVSADQTANGVHVRWHYSALGSSGSWSGTASVTPAPLTPTCPPGTVPCPPGCCTAT